MNNLPDDVINAGNSVQTSNCDQTSNLCQQLQLASEFSTDLTKNYKLSLEKIGLLLMKRYWGSLFSKFGWGPYNVSIAKTAIKDTLRLSTALKTSKSV